MAKLHFTKKRIEGIAPTAKLQSFTDDQTRGLTLKITPRGAKTFYYVRKFRGRTESTKVGRFPETTLAAARSRIARMASQYDAGVSPAQERRRERSELTLDAFFEIYFRDHCLAHNKSPDYARYHYEQYIAKALGQRRLSELRRADVAELHRELGRSGRERTANKVQGLLRAILNKPIAWEYLDAANPAQHIQRYREVDRDRFLSAEELSRFHTSLANETDTVRDFFLILLFTGARKQEGLRMRWDAIDLGEGLWRIADTKNREPRCVVLATPSLEILSRRNENRAPHEPWVFPGRTPGRHLVEPKRAWERVLDRAGIDDLRIHDLRRTHGSWMLSSGADLTTIGKALGHKDHASTLIYARLDLDPVRRAVEDAARRLNEGSKIL